MASDDIWTGIQEMASLGYPARSITLAVPIMDGMRPIWRVDYAIPDCEVTRSAIADGVCMAITCPTRSVYSVGEQAHVERLDADYLSLAWRLGAWDVARTERAPLPRWADPLDAKHGIANLVGDPYKIGNRPVDRVTGIDVDAWIAGCARAGWMHWQCKPAWPLHLRPEPVQRAARRDRTLRDDGSREPKSWRPWTPVCVGVDHMTVIRLGRAPHGNRSRRTGL